MADGMASAFTIRHQRAGLTDPDSVNIALNKLRAWSKAMRYSAIIHGNATETGPSQRFRRCRWCQLNRKRQPAC